MSDIRITQVSVGDQYGSPAITVGWKRWWSNGELEGEVSFTSTTDESLYKLFWDFQKGVEERVRSLVNPPTTTVYQSGDLTKKASVLRAASLATKAQSAEHGGRPTPNEQFLSEAIIELSEAVADLVDRFDGNGDYPKVLTEDDR